MKNPRLLSISIAAITGLGALGLPALAQAQASSLEEIVVTARKRQESAQDVPVAVTVFTADELDKRGIREFTDLSVNNPNVSIRAGANGAISNTVAIRGNVQNDVTSQIDPAVGTYIDGMVVGRTYGMNGSMIDMDTVQTLKGPQGTLFGRNTTGGALLITTVNPDVDAGVTGYVKGEYGQEGTQGFTGAVNLPLGNSAALRLVAHHDERDDYLNYQDGTDLGSHENQMLRAKLLWNISDATSALFTAERVEVDSVSTIVVATQPNDFSFSGMPNVGGVFVGGLITTPAVGSDQKQNAEVTTLNLNITHETEWGEVKFLTGQRDMDVNVNLTLPPGLGYTIQDKPDLSQFTAEIQVNGSFLGDRLDLTSGLYYFDEETNEDQLTGTYPEIHTVLPFPVFLTGILMETQMKSMSAYVQGTYRLTEATNLTLGGRFTDDDRESSGFNGTFPGGPQRPLTWQGDEREFNYLVTLDHSFSENLMAYVTTSTGYRSAGANLAPRSASPTETEWASFSPESIENYEAGLKSDWLDGTLRVNGAYFYQDYEDYQYTQIVIDPSTGGPVRAASTSDVTIEGFELEATVLLPADFTLSLSYGYTDGEIKSNGAALPNIPDVAYGVTLAKAIALDAGVIDLRAVYDHREEFYTAVGQEAPSTVDERSLLNLSATFDAGAWSATAYVNNVTNEKYIHHITYSPASPAAAGLFGLSFGAIGLPRIGGVKVAYNF